MTPAPTRSPLVTSAPRCDVLSAAPRPHRPSAEAHGELRGRGRGAAERGVALLCGATGREKAGRLLSRRTTFCRSAVDHPLRGLGVPGALHRDPGGGAVDL